jgi:hypothetical protein
MGGDLFQLSIDQAYCRYSPATKLLQYHSNEYRLLPPGVPPGCITTHASLPFGWGPIFGPGGLTDIVVGLPGNNPVGTGVIPQFSSTDCLW